MPPSWSFEIKLLCLPGLLALESTRFFSTNSYLLNICFWVIDSLDLSLSYCQWSPWGMAQGWMPTVVFWALLIWLCKACESWNLIWPFLHYQTKGQAEYITEHPRACYLAYSALKSASIVAEYRLSSQRTTWVLALPCLYGWVVLDNPPNFSEFWFSYQ